MKHSKFKFLITLLVLLSLLILSSCEEPQHEPTSEVQPAVSTEDFEEEEVKMDAEKSEVDEEKPPDISNPPEVQESQEPQEDFRAKYIGKTVADVVQDLGGEYAVDYYEGSTMIGYSGELWFLFGSTEDTITDDLIIRQMLSFEQYPAVYGLTGRMTYPEIVEAVKGEAEISQPDYYYNELDEEWEYILGFTYREYRVSYTWLDDPETTLSEFIGVLKQDVETLKPDELPPDSEPSEEPDRNDDLWEEESYFFCGPGWFEGVMGSRFYVPDGFIQQDFTPAVGHYYLFENAELDMRISVHEMTFMMLDVDSTAMADEYESRKASDTVAYATSGDNFYVVSGYYDSNGDAAIYYSRVDYDDMFRYEVEFLYPTSQAEEGEKILLEFLENYSVS